VSDIEDLRARMTALEATVAEQSRLRAAVDYDQADMGSKVRAMHHLVQALSITQSEHGERLSRIESTLMSLKQGQEKIVTLLNHLIERES
jgi:hypothetical protein